MNSTQLFSIKSRIWIYSESGSFLGEGRIELLRQIDATGSISKAAKEMKMSYKKAWQLVNSMNAQLQEPLVIGSIGGLNGGGSVLSDSGKRLIQLFTELNEKNRLFLNEELKKINFLK